MKFKLYFILIFLNTVLLAQNGIVKTYYPNGKIRSKESYADNILEGTSYFFYENGNLKKEITYSDGIVNGWVRNYYENGLLKEEFYVDFGVRDGVDKLFYENGALEEVRYYKQGKLQKTIHLDFDSTYIPPPSAYVGNNQQKILTKTNEIICDADECPAPIGGIAAIRRKAKYTEHAKLYGLEGDVIVVATIDTSGNVTETTVVKKLGLGLDEVACNAIKETKFFPGKKDGKPVISHATIKVNFSLGKQKHITVASTEGKKELKEFVEEELYGENENFNDYYDDGNNAVKGKEGLREKEVSKSEAKKEKKITKVQRKKIAINDKSINKTNEIKSLGIKVECFDTPCAKPIGGEEAILKNLKIPRRVKQNNIKGIVKIIAEVDKYGEVRNTKVLEGLPEGANDAAEVAIYYTKFKPAIKNGIRIPSKVIITIPFQY